MRRPWLQVEGVLPRHPKTRALAKLWHSHPYTVTGFLIALWSHCQEFQEDGDIRRCPSDVLDELAAPCLGQALGTIPGVVEVLQQVGFVDANGRLHDWEDYTGALVVKRRNERERKRLARSGVRRTSRAIPRHRGADVRGKSGSRVEQSRVEQSIKTPARTRGGREWVTPYIETWRRAFKGDPPIGQLKKFLRVYDELDAGRCLAAWERYLKATDALRASPARFAQTFGTWAPAAAHGDRHRPPISRRVIVDPGGSKRLELVELAPGQQYHGPGSVVAEA